jgi:hypothetical protein
MKTRLISALALAALCSTTAFAAEPARPPQKPAAAAPVKLTDAQMDTISAGGSKPGTTGGGGTAALSTNVAGRPAGNMALAIIRKIGG